MQEAQPPRRASVKTWHSASDDYDAKPLARQQELLSKLTAIYRKYRNNPCADCENVRMAISTPNKLYPAAAAAAPETPSEPSHSDGASPETPAPETTKGSL